MISAGWYPDPAGTPGAFRYWDGAAWGPQTTTNPGDPLPGGWQQEPPTVLPPSAPPTDAPAPYQQPAPPPPSSPPSAPPPASPPQGWADPAAQPGYGGYGGGYGGDYGGGYGGGGYGGGYGPQPSPSRGRRTALLVTAAVVVLVLVAAGAVLLVRGLGGDDPEADPSGDPTTGGSSSGGSTLDPENPTDAQCQGGNPYQREPSQDDGRMQSGGLSIPARSGFGVKRTESAFTFADRVVAVGQQVEPEWLAVYALGELPRANGYEELEQSALTVLTCMETNERFYTNITSDDQLSSEEVDVGGSPGWVVTAEIRVDQPGLTVDGDVAQVVVVDVGDDERFGLFVSVVPIDDQARIADQQQALEDLEVD